MSVTIRRLEAGDRAAWGELFAGYAEFYGVAQTEDMRTCVFGWLMDPDHTSNCFVAVDGQGRLIGLTHYRPFVSQLKAVTTCFLDDLFVAADARGSGAAQALIDAVTDVAREKGWGVVRWITGDENYTARRLYDKLATRTMWITYDRVPRPDRAGPQRLCSTSLSRRPNLSGHPGQIDANVRGSLGCGRGTSG